MRVRLLSTTVLAALLAIGLPGLAGAPVASAAAGDVTASAVCAYSTETDPVGDVGQLDVASVTMSHDCTTDVWTLTVQAKDTWTTEFRSRVLTLGFDSDLAADTGCNGEDYQYRGARLWRMYDCGNGQTVLDDGMSTPWGEDDDPLTGTVTFWVEGRAIDAGDSLRYTGALASDPSSTDQFPDAPSAYTVVPGPPPPPKPVALDPQDVRRACWNVQDAGFRDIRVTDQPHGTAVHCVAAWRVALGTTPSTYSPVQAVTRGQMATFVTRLIDKMGYGALQMPTRDYFTDDETSTHQSSINQLAEAGIVGGTGGGRFSPDAPVTRAQMAAFLTRAFEFHLKGIDAPTLTARGDYFPDDDGQTLEPAIDLAAEYGFTGGNADGTYRPGDSMRRDQMATFLARVLSLAIRGGTIGNIPNGIETL